MTLWVCSAPGAAAAALTTGSSSRKIPVAEKRNCQPPGARSNSVSALVTASSASVTTGLSPR